MREVLQMSRKYRRRDRRSRTMTPITGAGLVRFFEEDISGIKIKPLYVIVSSILFITIVLLAHLGLFAP